MIKTIIHKSIERSLSLLSFSFLQRKAAVKLTIPFYHIVSDKKSKLISNLYTYRSVAKFEDDLDFFQKHYTIIDLKTLLNYHKKSTSLPKNPLLLTFDDGMSEMIEIVAPILKKRKIPATFLITTDFLDNKNLFYRNKVSLLINFYENNKKNIDIKEVENCFKKHNIIFSNFNDNLKELKFEQNELIDEIAKLLNFSFEEFLEKETPYLNSFEVFDLIKQGFSVGAHSLNHRLYKDTTKEEQIRQTSESMSIMRTKFNLNYGVFAFPFNDEGLSKSFFTEMGKTKLVDVFFSTDGFLDDESEINYHRFWMEGTNENAKQIIIRNMKEKFIRQLKNKNRVER